jgi:hypothetical protein
MPSINRSGGDPFWLSTLAGVALFARNFAPQLIAQTGKPLLFISPSASNSALQA